MSEAEPRRSVRSTKGQHKNLEETAEQPVEGKRRGKKSQKAAEMDVEEAAQDDGADSNEVRCVCGAEDDSDDNSGPWIACEQCDVWQHTVCMGLSIYDDELEGLKYHCEQCKPSEHRKLLAAMKKGEKPWIARMAKYKEDKKREEEEEAARAANKKGKKGAAKKGGHAKQSDEADTSTASPRVSPAAEKKSVGSKRKHQEVAADKSNKVKLRKVSESESVPVSPGAYEPPADLPETIAGVEKTRQGSVKLLMKAIKSAMDEVEQAGNYNPADGVSNESRSERLAIAVEHAVNEANPVKNTYTAQVRTLQHNLKNNLELLGGLLDHSLTPPMLAVMTSDQLASTELQKENLALKLKADKQSILVSEEGPRIRRTHKGEEVVGEDELMAPPSEVDAAPRRSIAAADEPTTAVKEEVKDGAATDGAERQQPGLPPVSKKSFDINSAFRNVKSPTTVHRRKSSAQIPTGNADDADVDRMLQDDDMVESPPYSPKEESDPDVVWRGPVFMNTIGECEAVAKWAGGANLQTAIGLPWHKLIPPKLTVHGRIQEPVATEYLCSLRYSSPTDVVVVSLAPGTEASKEGFDKLVDYFTSKQRFGVVGDKGIGNVKDTYLIPLKAGNGNHPEFILNLEDNIVPQDRTENMLLLVLVYRNDVQAMEGLSISNGDAATVGQIPVAAAAPIDPLRASAGPGPGPAFSPSTPQVGFQGTPAPQAYGQPPGADPYEMPKGILGHLWNSPTMDFFKSQAAGMRREEWVVIARVLEREPKARVDLTTLSNFIQLEADKASKAAGQTAQQQEQAVMGAPLAMAPTQ